MGTDRSVAIKFAQWGGCAFLPVLLIVQRTVLYVGGKEGGSGGRWTAGRHRSCVDPALKACCCEMIEPQRGECRKRKSPCCEA